MWIWYLDDAEGGNIQKIAEKALSHGIGWVAVKSGNGINYWNQFTRALELKNYGLKVYSWSYLYGELEEYLPILDSLACGSDGHIIDAEAEFARVIDSSQLADSILNCVYEKFPEADIAYSPLPVIYNFPNFPYQKFNDRCKVAMPQFYTKELGTGYDYPVGRLSAIWGLFEKDVWGLLPKKVFPVLQGYGSQTSENLANEVDFCMTKYGGFSIWAWHTLTPDLWEVIKNA